MIASSLVLKRTKAEAKPRFLPQDLLIGRKESTIQLALQNMALSSGFEIRGDKFETKTEKYFFLEGNQTSWKVKIKRKISS